MGLPSISATGRLTSDVELRFTSAGKSCRTDRRRLQRKTKDSARRLGGRRHDIPGTSNYGQGQKAAGATTPRPTCPRHRTLRQLRTRQWREAHRHRSRQPPTSSPRQPRLNPPPRADHGSLYGGPVLDVRHPSGKPPHSPHPIRRTGERCAAWLANTPADIHHRRPRRMGGTSNPEIHQPANLVVVCRTCHRWIEENRQLALRARLAPSPNTTPASHTRSPSTPTAPGTSSTSNGTPTTSPSCSRRSP